MMEQKKNSNQNRMNNFSRSVDRPKDSRTNNTGVGYYTGPKGPNVVVENISKFSDAENTQQNSNNRYLRQVQSQQKLEKSKPTLI